ncbi:MAG: hypothetical protein ACRYGG_00015 [Janthinobacterium lividum]
MNKIQLKLALSITVAHCLSFSYASMNLDKDDYQKESSSGNIVLNDDISSSDAPQFLENRSLLYQSKLTMEPNHLLEISDLVTDNVLRFLDRKDLNEFGLTSKKALQKKKDYQERLLKFCLCSIMSSCGEELSNLADRQFQAHDKLKSVKIGGTNKSFREYMISEITDKIFKENRCAFLLKGSPLNLYVNQALLTPEGRYEHLSAFVFYEYNEDFRAFFDNELFSTERDESYKASIAQHLFSQIAIYAPKQTQDRTKGDNQALRSFLNDHKLQIAHYLKEVYTNNNYIQFSPNLMTEELTQDHHIVITDDQMADIANKEKLIALLDDRLNHKVVLDIGNVFGKDGILKLTTRNIPEDLAHLIITNTKGNVTSIGKNFLSYAKNLQSFDTAGLIGVESIGHSFLSDAL